MIHQMRLHPGPFDRMKSGAKNFEIRLNDEKRQQINIGDEIIFSKRPDFQDSFSVRVTSLDKYVDFSDLWQGVRGRYPKHTEESFIEAMYEYYSPEDEKRYGALVISFLRS